jgi:hypothetical protein
VPRAFGEKGERDQPEIAVRQHAPGAEESASASAESSSERSEAMAPAAELASHHFHDLGAGAAVAAPVVAPTAVM